MTKDKFNWRFCLCCGLFVWFVVNLLQGIFTEIQEDEAYYHLWGEHLDWGYFDHPPMVALMTFLSSILFSGTLGVRLFTIIASCLSLFVMWLIAIDRPFNPSIDSKRGDLNPKSILLFFIVSWSIVMFNIYGFVATPDSALILFSALFLFVYQRYLYENSWKNAIVMGIIMALMVYSKYHAFLLLGLIVMSNLRLLKDGKFYVACLLALALLMPHILWQINADFPSFRYHLLGRNEAFRWSYFWEYLPNQLLIFNPFTFGAVVYVLFQHKSWIASSYLLAMTPHLGLRVIASKAKQSTEKTPNQTFERGLKFILIGFFFFFWLMAFRGHVEPHWTIVCMIPAVVLVYRTALIDEKLRRYIKRFVMPSLLLIVAFRIALLTPLAARFGFSDKQKRYETIAKAADDNPVVFQGSFQKPALYHYFTGKPSSTLRSYYDRKTQYDLWQFDKDWIGKTVFVSGHLEGLSRHYQGDGVEVEGYLCDDFSTANRLVTTFEITNANAAMEFHQGDTLRIDFAIHNPCDAPIDFLRKDFRMVIKAHYLPGDTFSYCRYQKFGIIEPHSTYRGQMYTIVSSDFALGKYTFNLGIGDRIAAYVTDESGVEITIVP